MAIIIGINTQMVIYAVYFLGSMLAAFASIFISIDTNMSPFMGLNALLFGIIAVVIGGLGNILGAYLGGMFLGLVQHLGAWWTSSEWQDGIAFLVLLIFLIFRPQGFFVKPLKKAEI
jgi:branched-chain amino acid transport system permease protein